MPDHPVFERIEEDALRAAARVRGLFEPHHRAADAAPMTPATMPVNLATAPATQEETVSLATIEEEIGQRIAAAEAAVHDEIGKLVADLPAITAEAKTLAASPIGKLALTAAGHVAASLLPGGAIAYLAANWEADLKGLVDLYNPPAEAAAPADPVQPAEAPAAQ